LLRSLQRTAILTSEKFKGVRLNIDPRPARGVQQCRTGRVTMDIDYGGDAIEIGFNVTYLIDAPGQYEPGHEDRAGGLQQLGLMDHSGQHVLQVRCDAHAHLTHPTSR
jgi:hypothetical protein